MKIKRNAVKGRINDEILMYVYSHLRQVEAESKLM